MILLQPHHETGKMTCQVLTQHKLLQQQLTCRVSFQHGISSAWTCANTNAYLPALLVWVKAVLVQRLAWQVANQDLPIVNRPHARLMTQEVIEPAAQQSIEHIKLACPMHATTSRLLTTACYPSMGDLQSNAYDTAGHMALRANTCHGLHTQVSGLCKLPDSIHSRIQIWLPTPAYHQ